jgi:hypothetical protein
MGSEPRRGITVLAGQAVERLWPKPPQLIDGVPQFDPNRLAADELQELEAILGRRQPSPRDPHGLDPLSLEDLVRLIVLAHRGWGTDPESCPQGAPGCGCGRL